MEGIIVKILIQIGLRYAKEIAVFLLVLFLLLFVAITGFYTKPVKSENQNTNIVNAINETKQFLGIDAITYKKAYTLSLPDFVYAFPTTGTVTQKALEIGYAGNAHIAWDIANSNDTVPVYAGFDGTVTKSKLITQYTNYQWRFCGSQGGICYERIDEYKDIVLGCGNEIQIESEKVETLRFMYCHLDSRLVEVDQQVKIGDIIGYMGSTGWSTGKHLHFEVHYKGDSVDPKYFYER